MDMTRLREKLNGEITKGISKRELGKRIGIPFTSINNYLDTETVPTIDSLEKIADYFRVHVSYFFGVDATPTKQQPDTRSDEIPWEIRAAIEAQNLAIASQNEAIRQQGETITFLQSAVKGAHDRIDLQQNSLEEQQAIINEITKACLDASNMRDFQPLGKVRGK